MINTHKRKRHPSIWTYGPNLRKCECVCTRCITKHILHTFIANKNNYSNRVRCAMFLNVLRILYCGSPYIIHRASALWGIFKLSILDDAHVLWKHWSFKASIESISDVLTENYHYYTNKSRPIHVRYIVRAYFNNFNQWVSVFNWMLYISKNQFIAISIKYYSSCAIYGLRLWFVRDGQTKFW